VDAQPLYARGVVYVVTENDTIYAFRVTGGLLWSQHAGRPVPAMQRCRSTAPVIGMHSTPVIDLSNGAIYAVAYVMQRGKPAYVLYAFSAADGSIRRMRDISAFAGNAALQQQRTGLLLSRGALYVTFASFCDQHPALVAGRIAAFDASTFATRATFVTTASPRCRGYRMGNPWGLGFAPAADERGNVYLATGNGCIDYRHDPGGFSDAVLRFTSDLRLNDPRTDFFAPCTALADERHDQEIGSGGVALVPGSRYAIAGGKTGITFVLDRDRLGDRHCPDRVVGERLTNWGLWGGPAIWRSDDGAFVAVPGEGPQGVAVYGLSRTGRLSLRSQTNERLMNGGQPVIVTSNGLRASSVLLWALTRPTTGTVYLEAYDPLHMERTLLHVPAGWWSNPYGFVGGSPTVADGRVFVATDRRLTIWGL
jgi:hypothetical protein